MTIGIWEGFMGKQDPRIDAIISKSASGWMEEGKSRMWKNGKK